MKRCKLWKKAAAAVISLSLLCAAEIPAMAGIFYRPALTEIKTAGGTMLRAVSLLEEKYAVAASAEEAEVKTADTEAAQPQEREVAESEVDAFFSNSVLVGDSVMLGYRNYCMKSTDPFLKSLRFLASGSFSVHNALWPVNSESVHPIYQGAQRPVWESISLMQADKVFLFFGLNDLNMGDDTCECYQQVVANIKQLSPNASIYIISMTYTLKDKGKGKLNNDNIRLFNSQMQQIAAANGWGFIDMATPLSDANGDLAPEYCSDNYVHQSRAAYQVWTNVLRQYARDQLKYTPAPEV